MGVRKKVVVSIALVIIVALAVWQFTSPQPLSPVGDRYSTVGPYSNRGSWTIPESMRYGRAYLAISISNVTFPRTGLGTDYSLIISNVNQTITNTIVKGFGLRISGVDIQDNLDGSMSTCGNGNSLSDAVQATCVFFFATSANHILRFTVTSAVRSLAARLHSRQDRNCLFQHNPDGSLAFAC